LLTNLSLEEELQLIQNEDLGDHYLFPKLPCHTQTVELVTEASFNICGPENRNGFIRITLESRKKMSYFETKKDYKFSGTCINIVFSCPGWLIE